MAAHQESDRRDDRAAPAPSAHATGGRAVVVERIAHPDIPEITSLYRRVWESFRPPLPGELLKSWTPTPLEFTSWMEGVTYFAARQDGKMVGAVGCEISDGSCRLLHLVVDPEARRQGVGTALTSAAIDWARHSSSKSLWVDALDRFADAHALFRRLGFSESGVLHRHRWGEDVRLFEKLL